MGNEILCGRRVDYYSGEGAVLFPGEYGKIAGVWYCRPPWEHGSGCLVRHQVTEHENGTITVSPSIKITCYTETGRVVWHGYLERGVWREC